MIKKNDKVIWLIFAVLFIASMIGTFIEVGKIDTFGRDEDE
jgi:hypothetical protein